MTAPPPDAPGPPPLGAADALDVVRALADELGLPGTLEVLADKSHLVVRLGPRGPVARIAMATSSSGIGLGFLDREVAVARFLAARGGRVTRPTRDVDPGPYARGGVHVSLWELEDTVPFAAHDAADAGAELARLHARLADYPVSTLPRWGAIEEARAAFERSRRSGVLAGSAVVRLERAWSRAETTLATSEARSAAFQPVHGDAHVGNVLATRDGPLWTDWEDAFVGPVEYDLASAWSKAELFGESVGTLRALLDAYAAERARLGLAPCDEALQRELGAVRNAQVCAWLAVFAERQPEHLPRLEARLAHL